MRSIVVKGKINKADGLFMIMEQWFKTHLNKINELFKFRADEKICKNKKSSFTKLLFVFHWLFKSFIIKEDF